MTATPPTSADNAPQSDARATAVLPTGAAGVSWRAALVVTILLIGLSLAGFALTNYAPEHASWYWVLVLPAFAAIAMWQTWRSVRKEGKTDWAVVRKQLYHWVALLLAIKILFVLIYTGNVSGRGAGLVALLLMALTSALLGVSFDILFVFVGCVLACAVLIAAWFEEYVWLVLLALGLAFVLLVVVQWFGRKSGAS